MSSGAVTAYQAMGANASLGVGNPNYQQATLQQANTGYQPQQGGLKTDNILMSNEAAVPHPLLRDVDVAAYNAKRTDNIDSSEVHAKHDIEMFSLAVVLVMFIGVPLLREALKHRVLVRRDLFHEGTIQHPIQQLHQSQQDKTADWLEHHEDLYVKQLYINAIAGDMKETWEKLQSHNPEVRKAAEKRMVALGMPIEKDSKTKEWQFKGKEKMGAFHLPHPEHFRPLAMTADHVHAQVEALHKEGLADTDLVRLVNEQVNHYHAILTNTTTFKDHDHLIQTREGRSMKRWKAFHADAQSKFLTEYFRPKPSAIPGGKV